MVSTRMPWRDKEVEGETVFAELMQRKGRAKFEKSAKSRGADERIGGSEEDEIVQDMTHSRNVEFSGANPLERGRESFESLTGDAATHRETAVEIERALKGETQEVIVKRGDGDESEGILQVSLRHQASWSQTEHMVQQVSKSRR